MKNKNTLITVLGPTAIGKTKLAVKLADEIEGEIISADSRQVYQSMDIGTGKDLADYVINDRKISYHLIDIVKAGDKYDLFQFQQDFYRSYEDIIERDCQPILCGGSGLYLEAALAKKSMVAVPEDESMKKELESKNQEELNEILLSIQPHLHNTTDLKDKNRTIRAIEIAKFEKENPQASKPSPVKYHLIFGLRMDREKLRERIKDRLKDRLSAGMVEEVKLLLESGVSAETLDYYGLEYRFINQYLQGDLTYQEMFSQLLQAIRRFAKKQMTWFRRMERKGTEIYWLEADLGIEENLEEMKKQIHGKAI